MGAASYLLIPFFFYTSHSFLPNTWHTESDRLCTSVLAISTTALLFYIYSIGDGSFFSAGGIVGRSAYLFLSQWFDALLMSVTVYVLLIAQFLIISRLSLVTIAHAIHELCLSVYTYRHLWLTPLIKGFTFVVLGVFRLITALFRSLHRYYARKKLEKRAKQAEQYIAPVRCDDDQDMQTAQASVVQKEHVQRIPVSEITSQTTATYKMPGVQLFAGSEKQQQSQVTGEHTHMSKVLEEKLSRFGVVGIVTKIKPGPVVTMFEYQPDIDSKVSKILALEHDLALALEAMSVRIIAPIPGTSKVGFEVSNKERKSVKMGDIVRSSVYAQSRFHLPLVLGQDTAGDNVVVDLIDMPHLLVAGSTGSGKSIALNAMLASLLCKLSPDELKLIIIDPKRLEFAAYHDIAHLLFPVITDPRKAAPVTQWLVKTMEDRYELMAKKGVRNILDYKRMCKETGQQDTLPFIVLMIDELADLMMVAGKDIEGNIARLAQMARAAGIHLIVATQRPSVDVITGVIKVNFPSRISFRVSSKIDSRTILDTGGAELLLGKGDMLFMDAQSSRIRRVHGAYVSDSEISTLVNHIHAQQDVVYIDLQEALAAYQSAAAQQQEEQDPLLHEVMSFLSEIDEVSISLLQRRFKIGYNRSARLIEMLEMQGKVMPSMGGKMRKIVR